MSESHQPALTRRSLLLAGAAAATVAIMPRAKAAATRERRILAAPGRAPILGTPDSDTAVWCYDGQVPGPELRLRQAEPARILLENRLPQATTIHWHGVRVPNAADGAAPVTQPPIEPGDRFVYAFTPPDAGTYWYHPHLHGAEQVGRGLTGALIVEEPEPMAVDRELVWMLGDWRLRPDGSIAGGFGNPMEMAMAGRIGNTVTINGRDLDEVAVRSGERIRLRLINAAPARMFALAFRGHDPLVVALDGQPVEPHAPEGGLVVLGPAMRADLVIDMTGKPGTRHSVVDSFYDRMSYTLVDLAYTDKMPLGAKPLAPPPMLPPNPIPEPDLAAATRHEVVLTGGMMSGMGMGGMMGNGTRGMMGGSMWAINGVAVMHDDMAHMKPALTLDRGEPYLLAIENQTAWYHPIHLHGHSFRVVSRNGRQLERREWRDTVLVAPRERAEVAFVADNPGDWMFHCHVLDHQEGGMMSIVRVS